VGDKDKKTGGAAGGAPLPPTAEGCPLVKNPHKMEEVQLKKSRFDARISGFEILSEGIVV